MSTARIVAPEGVIIHTAGVTLRGDLAVPANPRGLVIFAHGSGSSRRSPRNRWVAEGLVTDGFATLLFDLLTPEEASVDSRTAHLRFDILLLAARLAGVSDWAASVPEIGGLPVGYFGASTGAAAALVAASDRPARVVAVVSRGGRPDLAGDYLTGVAAPTLLIVGGLDPEVLTLNRAALARMPGDMHRLVVVPGATHLFEEPGTLEQVQEHARAWFRRHLAPG